MIFYVKLFVFIILLDIDTKLVIVIFDNNVGTHSAAFKLLTVYKDVFEEFKFFYKAQRKRVKNQDFIRCGFRLLTRYSYVLPSIGKS